MRLKTIAPCVFMTTLFAAVTSQAQSEPYPAMAPSAQYLMPEGEEIALARSAAPKSISEQAEVMVLKKDGYATAVKGSNGFLCLVERGWDAGTDFSDFWNSRLRGPNCFNAAAAKSVAPIYLMKARLALQGKSKQEIAKAVSAAIDSKALPAPAPGAMCYMMSKQQYLNDGARSWHPHLMFFAAGDAARDWGANLQGSPMMASPDPEDRLTIFMMAADHWSDGTPAPAMEH